MPGRELRCFKSPVGDEAAERLTAYAVRHRRDHGVAVPGVMHQLMLALFRTRVNGKSFAQPYLWAPFVLVSAE
jgi:hypothetical protein